MATTGSCLPQAGVVAVRNGRVCLITSRNGKRWVIPKGCQEAGKTAGELALQEAWEEAGLSGALEREPIGTYTYEKAGTTCRVTVFLMHVTEAKEEWPEMNFRERRWLSGGRAMALVEDPGLRKLLGKIFTEVGIVLVGQD